MRRAILLPAAALLVLVGACASDVKQLEQTGNCPGCQLNRSALQGQDLAEANLIDAQLQRSRLQAADLHDARLRNARLSRANLNYAVLSGADLQGADLSNATLKEADLRYADLSRANLRGADLREVNWGQDDLQGAIAEDLPLWTELLQDAISEEVDLEEFEDLTPQEMLKLERGDLAQRLLVTALIQGSDLASDRLQDALSSVPDLRNATYDHSTRFPAGFDPEAADMRLVE